MRKENQIQSLRQNIASTLIRQIIGFIIGFAVSIIIARSLGPVKTGQFSLAVLLSTTLATIFNFGVSSSNVYFINQGKTNEKNIVFSNLALWLLFSVLGLLIGGYLTFYRPVNWLPNISKSLTLISISCFPILLLQAYLLSILQAKQDFKSYNLSALLIPVSTLLLTSIFLLALKFEVYGAFGAFIAGYFCSILTIAYLIPSSMRRFSESSPKATIMYAKQSFSYAWKTHVSNLLTVINYRADILLINFFLSPYEVGLYAVSIQIAEKIWILSNSTSAVVFPKLSGSLNEGKNRESLTPQIARMTLIGSTIIAIPISLFSHQIITTLFGPEFTRSVSTLICLLPGIVTLSFARILANDIAARNRPDINMKISLIVSIANIAFNIFLIPRFGILGAAISTTISYFINTLLSVIAYSYLSKNRCFTVLNG